jgi:hypothetical protein
MFLLHAHGAEGESFLSEVLLHGLLECAKLLPFLFVTYLLMEYIEHRAARRAEGFIRSARGYAPVLGGLLGALPQCGFSAAAANLYSGGIITVGTLVAVFLSTSDEMLPILISGNFSAAAIFSILGYKAVCAIICGVLLDLVMRKIKGKNGEELEYHHHEAEHSHEHHSHETEHSHEHHSHEAEHQNDSHQHEDHTHSEEETDHAHEDAHNHDEEKRLSREHEHAHNHDHALEHNHDDEECHICHEGYGHCSHGVFASAAFHTAKTAGFVLFVTLIINSAMFFVGEEELFAALPKLPVLSHLLAAIFGLIPNCAASVALTSLAASGIISSGEMLAGLFSGAGVGLAVLLRNKIEKGKKIRILAILVVAGAVFGLLADLILPNILFW